MRLKYYISIILSLLLYDNIYAQNIVEQLKQFYSNADMDCYIAEIQKNVNEYFVLENKIWGLDKIGIPPQKIELHKEEIVPMLTIQFINTDSFDLNDDIYNYIAIDSSIVFTLAIVDKRMNVKAFANFYCYVCGYLEIYNGLSIKNFFKRKYLTHVIKNINKQKPEAILYSSALDIEVLCGIDDYNGFMYIKDGKIYVYRVIEKKSYELNDYIRKFLTLDMIRHLNYSYKPIIYELDQSSPRRTGNTPENEKLKCIIEKK